ncbi:GH36-type glycosyl hydrolase domain-containing protein [Spirochaeta dissipatitropha]
MNSWEFTGKDAVFRLENADAVRGVYFPVANEAGFMASICPDGGGDAKIDHNHFLMPPVSVVDLHNSRLKRTAWLIQENQTPWSITGSSHAQKNSEAESQSIEAGLLWHKTSRQSGDKKLESEMLTFSPAASERLEVSRISIKNNGNSTVKISLVPVYPLYGRSADSLRDHRHVTSLLNRVQVTDQGMHLIPTMSFDERGHKKNTTVYSVLAQDSHGTAPIGCYPDLDRYIGERGDAERPQAVFDKDYAAGVVKISGNTVEGCESIAALQFSPVEIAPGAVYSVFMISGVFETAAEAEDALKLYASEDGFSAALDKNRAFWAEKTEPVLCGLQDEKFNQWMRWVSVQPILRRIYGCSFLPYHDYGRGGRGWRDLWQDCLALLLMEPDDVRKLLLSNFAGIRFDGTNATIIGSEPGSFLADRNNIPRVWMDHGAWPVLTVKLYIDQSGDLDFLTEQQEYFSDSLWARAAQRRDTAAGADTRLRTSAGDIYTGTVFEHMLLQQLSAFFHVGEHNTLLLEGADWNDGLDMADEKGESVAFSSLYAANLQWLAEAAEHLAAAGSEIMIADELLILLDRYNGTPIDYTNPDSKQQLLSSYFVNASEGPAGKRTAVNAASLAADLREKADHLLLHIRKNEWIDSSSGHGWFNGYYDNKGKRVEGDFPGGVRMTLTGQVFSLLSGAADSSQVKKIISAADTFLCDPAVGGYRLNTDFQEVKLDLGRCFGFAYGHKENGAMFSHMAVMYAYALYARGEAAAGWKVMKMMHSAASDFSRSRMYPGLPEYFDPDGRGLYCYLTGSASWYLLTLVTRMFGVRGAWGDLIIDPQLASEQWGASDMVSIQTYFRGASLQVEFLNPERLDAGFYRVKKIEINGAESVFTAEESGVKIAASSLSDSGARITVHLGSA